MDRMNKKDVNLSEFKQIKKSIQIFFFVVVFPRVLNGIAIETNNFLLEQLSLSSCNYSNYSMM